jgi:hypothetical protein
MNHINSIQITTDDGETISVFLEDSIAEIDENKCVTLQVPVFADGRSGHIYLGSNEALFFTRTKLIREVTEWALSSRTMTRKS